MPTQQQQSYRSSAWFSPVTWNSKAVKQIQGTTIIAIYLSSTRTVSVCHYATKDKQLTRLKKESLTFKNDLQDKMAYDGYDGELAVLDKEGHVWVGSLFESSQPMSSAMEQKVSQVASLSKEVVKLQFVRVEGTLLLCITNDHN